MIESSLHTVQFYLFFPLCKCTVQNTQYSYGSALEGERLGGLESLRIPRVTS